MKIGVGADELLLCAAGLIAIFYWSKLFIVHNGHLHFFLVMLAFCFAVVCKVHYVNRLMAEQTIAEAWHSSFGPALPAGYMCRTTLPDRWMRIHSLPESKRYPNTEAERDEVLRRQNAAACYALGEGSECILFITEYGESQHWPDYYVEGSRYTAEFVVLNRFAPEYVQSYDKGQDGPLQFFATRQRWHAGAFDALILMCADGTAGPYLFANIEKGSAYAPYDGGADLFFSASYCVGEARRKFSDWLSTIESGL